MWLSWMHLKSLSCPSWPSQLEARAVQLALRHPDRVTALVLVAANSPHEKAVSLVPRALAPLLLSQPSMWLLRVFAPKQLASISGVPTGYELDPNDQRTLETIFEAFPDGPSVGGLHLRRLRRQLGHRELSA